MFAARTGDDQSPRDNEENASSNENASPKSESEEAKDSEGRKLLELQNLGHARVGGGQGIDAAEKQERPGERERARETSQKNLETAEHIIRAEGERYSKEEDEDYDNDEVQTDLSSEGSGVEMEGAHAMEQQLERRRQQAQGMQEALRMQEDGALFAADCKERGGGSGMGGIGKGMEGEGTERTLGEEEHAAEWNTQLMMTPAQQLGEPSEEVGEIPRPQ